MEQTNLANTIEATGKEIQYDTNIKKVLANKYILAWILKYATPEFADCDIETIRNAIEGEPEIATVPVLPGLTNMPVITGQATEDAIPHEGKITYDIRFHVLAQKEEQIKILINVEGQNKFTPGYDLVTRGIFYVARMISAQLDTEFTVNTNDPVKYDNIKKVYSIWICTDCPKYARNTITSYDMKQTKIYGNYNGKARFDLMSVVMICLDDDIHKKDSSELIRMLSVLLTSKLDFENKKKIMEEFDIPMTQKFEEEVTRMCNLSEGVKEIGRAEGLKEGLKKGLEEGKFDTLASLVKDNLLTLKEAARRASLSPEAFKEKMEQMANAPKENV